VNVAGVIFNKAVVIGIYVVLVAGTAVLFKQVPSGFVPNQDKQYLVGFARLPDGATLDRTEEVIRKILLRREAEFYLMNVEIVQGGGSVEQHPKLFVAAAVGAMIDLDAGMPLGPVNRPVLHVLLERHTRVIGPQDR